MKKILMAILCVLVVSAGIWEVSAVPLFTDAQKTAVFLSPLEQWMPTWNIYGYLDPI